MKKYAWQISIIALLCCMLLYSNLPVVQYSTNTAPTQIPYTGDLTVPSNGGQVNPTDQVGASKLDQVENTQHFMILFSPGEETSAGYIGLVLEDNLERVCTDLGQCPNEAIPVFIYPDLQSFHNEIGYPDAPDWVVGMGTDGKIQIVSPRLLSSALVDKGVVHELVHVLHYQINADAPIWMREGMAMYEAGMSEGVREAVTKGIHENKVPALTTLENQDPEAFAQMDGYAYSFTVIDFVVRTYGKEILKEWIKNPRAYERVFGISGENFDKLWNNDLQARYKT